jgi:hypothetical protein
MYINCVLFWTIWLKISIAGQFSVKFAAIEENVSVVLELTLDYRQTTNITSTEDVFFFTL